MGVVLFYTAAVGFASGIFMRSFMDIGLPGITFAVLISFVLALLWRRGSLPAQVGEAPAAPYVLPASVFLFLFALGALRMEWASWYETNAYFESMLGDEVVLQGVIAREPDVRETTTHLYVAVEKPEAADGEAVLVFADRFGEYAYGDVIELTGELAQPESFETDLGRTFDYPGYLRAQGVNYVVYRPEITRIGSGEGNAVFAALLDFKHAFMQSIESILPEPEVGLGEGLLLGVKRALGEDLEEAFRKTGIIHIVVLSGYNVMLVVAFVTYLLTAVLPVRAQLPFGLAAIAAFAFMVGLSATVVVSQKFVRKMKLNLGHIVCHCHINVTHKQV